VPFAATLYVFTVALSWLATATIVPSGLNAISRGLAPVGFGEPGAGVRTPSGATVKTEKLAPKLFAAPTRPPDGLKSTATGPGPDAKGDPGTGSNADAATAPGAEDKQAAATTTDAVAHRRARVTPRSNSTARTAVDGFFLRSTAEMRCTTCSFDRR
jgi:hypothetical protein